MSETRFTPGPWECHPDGTIWAGPNGKSILKYASPFVEGAWEGEPEAIANGNLMAAAPELYEALDQLLDDMGDDGLSVCQAAKDQARAALSKARGET